MCIQEEERLKHEKLKTANLAFHVKGKDTKGNGVPQEKNEKVPIKRYGNEGVCFFC